MFLAKVRDCSRDSNTAMHVVQSCLLLKIILSVSDNFNCACRFVGA